MSNPLPFADPRWQNYKGGYRTPFDASKILIKLLGRGPSDAIWERLWDELHHQGDVDSASYASVPWLVQFIRQSPRLDYNALALIAVIELERPTNPAIPPELHAVYFNAIRELPAIVGSHHDQSWDELVTRAAIACIALGRGQRWYAKACFELDRGTAERWFSEEFGWDLKDDLK